MLFYSTSKKQIFKYDPRTKTSFYILNTPDVVEYFRLQFPVIESTPETYGDKKQPGGNGEKPNKGDAMKPDMGDEDEDADTGSTDTDKFEPATISSKGYLIYKKDGAIITRDLEDEQKMFRTERKEEVSSAVDPVRMMRYFATGGSEIFKEPLSIGVVRSKHLYLFVISFALQFTLYGKQPQAHCYHKLCYNLESLFRTHCHFCGKLW